MPTQIEMAKVARQHLSENNPLPAVEVLEQLAGELSRGEFVKRSEMDRKAISAELEGLRLLAAQGADLYGKWLDRVTPVGGSYNCHGCLSATRSEVGSGFQLGQDLLA